MRTVGRAGLLGPPGREELLALADEIVAHGDNRTYNRLAAMQVRAIVRDLASALRLAAKPADDVREATIEECAKVLDDCAQDWNRIRDPGMANNARAYARKIRALATTGEPKR